MASSAANTLSLLRAALLGTTVLILVGPTGAAARVGVTSATDGDPLGKPPSEAERVLRIGIDVQANEIITTNNNDRAHLVFLDGTAITVGPNARLTIDKFVYDPATKTGELALNASKGVLRLVGGKISKTTPITITTPSSTIGIRGGMLLLEVAQNKTTSTMLFGSNMSVNAGGVVQNATRAGSQVTTSAGAQPGTPTIVGQGALNSQIAALEGKSSGGSGGSTGGSGGAGGGGSAEQGAQTFGQQNSAKGPSVGPQPTNTFVPASNNGNGITQALTNTNQENQKKNETIVTPPTTTTTSVTSSQVTIVTRGRFLADPIYSNFNNTDFSVTPSATNNQLLATAAPVTTTTTTTTTGGSTTSSTSRTVTITTSDNRQITLPWQPGTLDGGFSIPNVQAFGANLREGRGYVSSNNEFFAFIFTTTGDNKVGFFGGTPTAPTGIGDFPTTGLASYDIKNVGAVNRIPFASGDLGDMASLPADKKVSKLFTAYSTALTQTVGLPPPDQRSTAMQATIMISGQGDQQKSYMGVFIGTFFRDINTTGGVITTDKGVGMSGAYGATYRQSADGRIGREISNLATPETGAGNAIFGTTGKDGPASTIVLAPDRLTSTASIGLGVVTDITANRTAQASFNQPYTNLAGSDYYSLNVATNPTAITGTTRTSQSLNGFVGGLVDQVDSGSNFNTRIIGTSNPNDLTLTTSATNNRAAATITVDQWDANSPGTSATFRLGGTTGGNSNIGSFVDDNTYAVRDRPADVLNDTTIIGGQTGLNVTSRTVAVSYNSAPIASLFSNAGVTPCTCAFLTWGWWGGDISYANNPGVYNAGGRDRLNFATYVAGTLSTAADVTAQTSTATYRGAMVGNVNDNGKSYIAAGSYQNAWNFGSRSGVVTATFDGRTYGGGVTANTFNPANTNTFSTTNGGVPTPIASGNRSLTVNGAFFSGGAGNPVAGQAGTFAVTNTTGTPYKAGGTFAAQK